MDELFDCAAVANLIENNWEEFVDLSGGEEDAQRSLDAIKEIGNLA